MPAAKLLDPSGGRVRLDRYELVAELASGGMATVFLGRIAGVGGFQRFVAIKRLHPHLANEPEFVDMFLDEARLAARIHHPNVVPIVDIGQSERGYYLVMEYIEGDTLARLLARATGRGEKLPPAIAMRIALDTLAGLHAAHDLVDESGALLGLVHRDVSPQNVLVGVDGSARITDFGVARAASRISSTRAGQLKGKLAYMAPEQARSQDVDRRADVFAVGTVIWEALAGKRLFKAEGEAETLSRVLFDPVPRLREIAPEVPAMIEAIVMRALERDRERRWATCAELGDALERAASLVQWVATPREVAAHVQTVLGQEVAQQREAVRAWLAMSEASRPLLPGGLPIGPYDIPVSTLSPASLGVGATSSQVTSVEVLTPQLSAVRMSATGLPVASLPPAEPLAVRWGQVALAAVVGALIVGVIGWIAVRVQRPAARPAVVAAAPAPEERPSLPAASSASVAAAAVPSASAAAAAVASAEPAPSASATPAASATAASAPVAPPTSAAPPAVTAVSPAALPPAAPAARAARPGAASRPAAADDISRNPYR